MIEINFILFFMIVAAIVAVEVKDLLSGVIAVGAVGIGLSMAFLVLKAPDLAVMQLVVEILCLIILIRATVRKDLPFSTSGRWFFNTLSTLCFLAVFLALAYLSIKEMPPFGEPEMRVGKMYIAEAQARTGALNVVSAIASNFRVYDTLGEVAIIFTAVVGVLAIARSVAHRKEGSHDGA
ncbi:MAG: hydrogen gas-evolving membrane-bound hydrogenase subunit E [Candidatus Omnitrophota bacterium]